jgi:hypothetical protein
MSLILVEHPVSNCVFMQTAFDSIDTFHLLLFMTSRSHFPTGSQSVSSQSVRDAFLASSPLWALFDSYYVVRVGRPLLREVGSVVCQS